MQQAAPVSNRNGDLLFYGIIGKEKTWEFTHYLSLTWTLNQSFNVYHCY